MAKKNTAKQEDTKVNVEIEDTKVDATIANEEETTVEENEEVSEENKIEELQTALDEQKNKYLRLFADFDNYKKRTAKEKLELLQTAGKDVMLSIIPTLDDLARAIQSAENATEIEAVKEGMLLVKNKLFNALSQKGLKPIESTGFEFDADKHEAITKIPAPSKEMKAKVIDTIETGYTLNDKIIRYSKVVVGE